MTVATRTIRINAGFLRKVKSDNRRLRSLLRHADQTFFLTGANSPRRVNRLLGELRDQLSMHFALEEMFGYFEEDVAVSPGLAVACEARRTEHVPLLMEICDIAEQAERIVCREAPEQELQRVGLRFRAFLDQLLAHETREIDLILEAMVVNTGAEHTDD